MYAYDAIGNRSTLTEDGSVVTTYKPNDLNQYERWDRPDGTLARQGFEYDADGNLTSTWLAGDMDGNGQTGFEDINPFVKAVSEGEAAFCLEYPTMCDNFMHADVDGNGSVGFEDINPFVDLTTYGNAGAARTYTWDAANRLSAVAPALDTSLLTADHRRVEFAYDYRNRMIAKLTYAWNPNATPDPTWELSAQRKFVWSDWLLLLELDGLNGDAVVRKYTWGLDLAGLNGGDSSGASPAFLESAGGIGGLLATKNEPGGPATHAALTYDANGNVTQAFQWSTTDPNAALVAHYEYDPYGNRINTPDPSEYDQPFRFSTKMYDPTCELSYFGYRHYSPALGRWINRDPIGEKGGKNLYAFVENTPLISVDPLGEGVFFTGGGERRSRGMGFSMDNDTPMRRSWDRAGETRIGTMWINIQDCCRNCLGTGSISAGIYISRTGVLRLRYEEAVARLAMMQGKYGPITELCRKNGARTAVDLYRLQLQRKFYEWQTKWGKEVTKAYRKAKPLHFGNASRHSVKYTNSARLCSRVGKGCMAIGVAIDIAFITFAEEDERPELVARTTGSLGTAWAGTVAGGCCGSCFGPGGTLAGAIIGGVAGACGGDWIVKKAIEW